MGSNLNRKQCITGKPKKKGPPLPNKIEIEPTPQPMTTPEHIDTKTTIKIGGDQTIEIEPDNLETVAELGRGAYGIVEKVKHKPTGFEMAVKVLLFDIHLITIKFNGFPFFKRISATIVQEQKRLLMDMNVLVNAKGCPNIVLDISLYDFISI